jgi:hypothetical protein
MPLIPLWAFVAYSRVNFMQQYQLGYGLDCPGFESWYRQDVFIHSKISRPLLVPTQPRVQCVSGVFLRVKRSGREANQSPRSNPEAKN